ncbi:helix-turn-helix transcriptional regulator [Adlercreutzia shanghongiae]|uniref:Helix-turn-helix transcriptional regulator n=1 Tax=Adlercreutzia shanghongiae TaxID=3111773 RepID=A0ABU6IYS7_9ACTN|nr:helix-turn-helix transcriptional regulator [Adlercreutzia sp. R22]MEC4294654.1 helix-turn-helix transcriptional regulator [Adlercreutzia sp. R22]
MSGAPDGYWWAVASLVALISATMLMHESASWVLDLASLWGAPVNIRAYSCDAHSLGLVFGYAITQVCGSRFARLVREGLFWTLFFIAMLVDVLAFYWCLFAPSAVFVVVAVQFVGAAAGAWFFVAISQIAWAADTRLFVTTVVAVVGLTTLIVQGLFSMLEATAPLLVSELLHLGLVIVAALCLVRAMAPRSCFMSAYGEVVFAPIQSRGNPKAAGSMPPDDGEAPSGGGALTVALRRRLPLCTRLFVIVGAYGAVFGFLHVIPLALPLGVVSRVSSFIAGALIALALFALTLRGGKGVDVSLIWNRFYRFVFPVVCVAALLGPLTNDTEFLPALVMQACALYYFDALLAMACSVIARAIDAAPSQVFARAFLIRSIGFLFGNLIGSTVYEHVVLDTAAFSIIGTAVFVLLVAVTFNMNSERYAKTVWGLLPREDPRGRYERAREERCDALAAQCGLTDREAEVLRLLAQNKRPREISDLLVVSVATVRSHVHAIYTKTGVHSSGELVKLVECPQDKS